MCFNVVQRYKTIGNVLMCVTLFLRFFCSLDFAGQLVAGSNVIVGIQIAFDTLFGRFLKFCIRQHYAG